MIEIMPRFGLPLDLARRERDLEAPEFHLTPKQGEPSAPKAPFGELPQLQFFYADPNGAGGTGTSAVRHGQASSSPLGTAPGPGPKQIVQTKNTDGGTTVKLKDFAPPGWGDADGEPAACYRRPW